MDETMDSRDLNPGSKTKGDLSYSTTRNVTSHTHTFVQCCSGKKAESIRLEILNKPHN